jgi:Super-infection exclusion protein B
MWDFLKHLKEFLSLDYRSLFILACVSWVIVVIPINIWREIGLVNLWQQIRPVVFIIGLLATVWLLSRGLYDLVTVNIDTIKKQKASEELILTLSRVEKEILARYMFEDTTTLSFDVRDGIVNGLVTKGIL